MNGLEWAYRASGLGLREDEYSWQGSYKEDNRVFLRRDKQQPELLTDLLPGNATEELLAELVQEFLISSGGVTGSHLIVLCAASAADDHSRVVDEFDRTKRICVLALERLGVSVRDCLLDQWQGDWCVRVDLEV